MTDPHAVPLDPTHEPRDPDSHPMFPPPVEATPPMAWPRPEPVVTGVEPPTDEVEPLLPAPKAGKKRVAALLVVTLGIAATGWFYLKGQNTRELAAKPGKAKDETRIPPQMVEPKADEPPPWNPHTTEPEPPKPVDSVPLRETSAAGGSLTFGSGQPQGNEPAKPNSATLLPVAPIPPAPLPDASQTTFGSGMTLPPVPTEEKNRTGGPTMPSIPTLPVMGESAAPEPFSTMPAADPNLRQAQGEAPAAPLMPDPSKPAAGNDPLKPLVAPATNPVVGPKPSGVAPPTPPPAMPAAPTKLDAATIPNLPQLGGIALPLPKLDAAPIPTVAETKLTFEPMAIPAAQGAGQTVDPKPNLDAAKVAPLPPSIPEFKPVPNLPAVIETKPYAPPVMTEVMNEIQPSSAPPAQPAPPIGTPPLPLANPFPKPSAPAPTRETVSADPTIRRAEYEVNLVSVRRGDSYDAIAKDSLGDAKYGDLLRRYNGERDLQVGEVVKVPPAPVLRKLAGPSWTGAPDAPKPAAARSYVTARDGMSMWDIAYEVYGTKAEFRKVIDANRDRNPNLRYRAGERFRLPPE